MHSSRAEPITGTVRADDRVLTWRRGSPWTPPTRELDGRSTSRGVQGGQGLAALTDKISRRPPKSRSGMSRPCLRRASSTRIPSESTLTKDQRQPRTRINFIERLKMHLKVVCRKCDGKRKARKR